MWQKSKTTRSNPTDSSGSGNDSILSQYCASVLYCIRIKEKFRNSSMLGVAVVADASKWASEFQVSKTESPILTLIDFGEKQINII